MRDGIQKRQVAKSDVGPEEQLARNWNNFLLAVH